MSVRLDAEARRLIARLPAAFGDVADAAQLVIVWATAGSAPRAIGARLLCRQGALLDGTIGGGRLEARAIEHAAELAKGVAGGRFEPEVVRFQLGPELAQCCGGAVELLFLPLDGHRARRMAEELDDATRTGGELRTTCGEQVLVERVDGDPTVVIWGAGHVGTALAQALAVLPWRIIVVDERPRWADPDRLPERAEVLCARPMQVLSAWGWLGPEAGATQAATRLRSQIPMPPTPSTTAALVMTHAHELDGELTDALLRLSQRIECAELCHVGLIGSRTKINSLRQRLRGRGLSDVRLGRLAAPMGLRIDGQLLGGKLPGEIAISVAAELLTVMRNETTSA